jgi:hypothetical protein
MMLLAVGVWRRPDKCADPPRDRDHLPCHVAADFGYANHVAIGALMEKARGRGGCGAVGPLWERSPLAVV